ncbi:formate dehydrogenase major subunit [Texcoconibacillus texcoconensis]|uniref:Formate dehydrogenase major subunit n=1 Tax=Texcoconibacillus texcoconensis TaxID=1095777 RepID=A0A840QNA4_9BACI|nr:formate dehydrogenase major subunit [Texcoconibacillus texcoconensis]
MMELSRRQFLKLSGATAATLAVVELGFDPKKAQAESNEFKIAHSEVTPTICPYCSVGCGILVHVKDGDVVYTEGDPDHPINRGTLCPKGNGIRQLYTSEKRVERPKYRAPGSTEWEEVDWDWALGRIAENVKKTRDESFVVEEDGMTVNHTEAIANLGGAALENEEVYMIQKLMRGLGLTYIEHQARI